MLSCLLECSQLLTRLCVCPGKASGTSGAPQAFQISLDPSIQPSKFLALAFPGLATSTISFR